MHVRRIGLAGGAVVWMLTVAGCGTIQEDPARAVPAPVTSVVPASAVDPLAWNLPADIGAAVAAAGLPMLGEEILTVHYHVHLDVFIRGRRVPVPANIGIDEASEELSPLHVHDDSGVVHIESGEDVPFTLGQLFTEWGQPLTATQVGPVIAGQGEQVRIYRNGRVVAGPPADLRFVDGDQIVVWVGPVGARPRVPASYPFDTEDYGSSEDSSGGRRRGRG